MKNFLAPTLIGTAAAAALIAGAAVGNANSSRPTQPAETFQETVGAPVLKRSLSNRRFVKMDQCCCRISGFAGYFYEWTSRRACPNHNGGKCVSSSYCRR